MKRYLLLLICFLSMEMLLAQTSTISGIVKDEMGAPVSGANVQVVDGTMGAFTDFDGNFELETRKDFPFKLRVSFTGYKTIEVDVESGLQQIEVVLRAESSMLDEVVVSASRVEERLLESPVSVEKMDMSIIKSAPSADYFDQITKLKGVTTASGSMTFNSINTRGFGGIDNTRFVQLVDGIDNSAPLLNFPMGNLIGISENDIKDVELVPGAASALYGPNAFNGIMLMESLSPFDKEGLTIGVKGGVTKASNDKSHPLYDIDVRFAKTFGKFGIKISGGYLGAKDWKANDYHTDIVTKQQYTRDPSISSSGDIDPGDRPNDFNGMNTYGDEGILSSVPLGQLQTLDPTMAGGIAQGVAAAIVAANPAVEQMLGGMQGVENYVLNSMTQMPTVDIRRTGLTEDELLDNNKATSLKGALGLYYKINDDTEINYTFRIGAGNSIYQGSERYALRDFIALSNKLEAKGKNFMFRTYMTQTDAGDSYNMTPLGSYTLENMYGTALLPGQSGPGWAGAYLGQFVGTLTGASLQTQQSVADLLQANPALLNQAHAAGRLAADGLMPAPGSPERQEAIERIRNTLFQHADPANAIVGGAGFKDKSRLFHTEGTYDFSSLLNDELNVLVGANHRLYSLYTYGTIFNEDPDGAGDDKRININEYGGFVQLSKQLFEDHLRLTGSLRYDKNENFSGIVTPRLSAVTTFGEQRQHNIRASYQTGFRNPHTQAQYIYFPASNILLGGTKDNAERYGIYEGGAYTAKSFAEFRNSVLAGAPDPSLLKEAYMDYIKPEKLSTVELGYKAVIDGLYIDWNVYYNWYKDFITQQNVVPKVATSQKGETLYGVEDFINSGGANTPAEFRPYYNQSDKVESWGTAIGLSYTLGSGYRISGNYNFMDFKTKDKDVEKELGFNSPKHMVNIGINNGNIANTGIGFDVSYRWQSAFDWVSSFGSGRVKAFNTFDAAAFYKVSAWHTTFKLGGTNLIGPSYRTNIGGPYIGKVITLGVTYDTDFGWGRK